MPRYNALFSARLQQEAQGRQFRGPSMLPHQPQHRRRAARSMKSWRRAGFEALEPRCLLCAQSPAQLVDLSHLVADSSQYDASRIIVALRDGVSESSAQLLTTATLRGQAVTADGRSLGATQRLMDGIYAVNLAPGVTVAEALAAYQADGDVLSAEADYVIRVDAMPNDGSFGQLWGLNNTGQNAGTADADIDAPEAWNITTGGGNFVIAVIDTGVDYNHPDLLHNIWVNPGEISGNGLDDDQNGYVDDTVGWDFANNDNNPMDDNGHGTHVSGTIAAEGNNGIGVAGVNWNAKIMPLKFLTSSGSGLVSNAVRALDYAVAMGVKLSNNSWSSLANSTTLAAAVSRASDAGHIVVAAAGNNGQNADVQPVYPSAFVYDNIVSVAATDQKDQLASFSNYGATSVDLAAPGVSVYSTMPNNSYGTLSGTSMATPHVTGAVALVWDKFPSLDYHQVINLVLNNTTKLTGLSGKVVSGGRLNVNDALRAAGGVDAPSDPPPGDSVPPPPVETLVSGSNPTDVTIRDLRTVRSYITINQHMTITDVDVWVDIRHRNDSHLRFTVYAPSDVASANLAHRVGGSGDNFSVTTFDDAVSQGIASGAAPFNGTYRPAQALSKFNGLDAYGTWRLNIYDYVRGTTGTLAGWGVVIRGVTASGQSIRMTLPLGQAMGADQVAALAGLDSASGKTRCDGSSKPGNAAGALMTQQPAASCPARLRPQSVSAAVDHVLADGRWGVTSAKSKPASGGDTLCEKLAVDAVLAAA